MSAQTRTQSDLFGLNAVFAQGFLRISAGNPPAVFALAALSL
jgi:hypothetical protein